MSHLPSEITFASLMVLLAERSMEAWTDERGLVHPKLSFQERIEQCYDWAEIYGDKRSLADDLCHAARVFVTTMEEAQEKERRRRRALQEHPSWTALNPLPTT